MTMTLAPSSCLSRGMLSFPALEENEIFTYQGVTVCDTGKRRPTVGRKQESLFSAPISQAGSPYNNQVEQRWLANFPL